MTATASPILPDASAELAALRRMLGIARGSFSLSFAVCNSPAERDRIIARLHDDFPDIDVISIPNDATDPFSSVSRELDARHPAAVFVIDLERAVRSEAAGQNVLLALNASRELWPRSLPCPVVFWLPEYAATLVSTHARDFWRYRSHRFQFDVHPDAAASPSHGHSSEPVWAATSLTREEKEARMRELRRRLVEADNGNNSELAVYTFAWLNELSRISFSLGMLDEAYRYAHEMLERAGRVADECSKAPAYARLGDVLNSRGDLDGAEAMYRKALSINEECGKLDSIAAQYGNLGVVLETRGDLDGAEAMFRKALGLNERLGRPQGMATDYSNLGVVLRARGDLDGSEAMHRKSLAIHAELGRVEGMANDYRNLGVVLRARGDLDGSEAMHRKSLAINAALGRVEGMAKDYGNLGVVLRARGDLDGAKEMWNKSRDLFARLGAKHMVRRMQVGIDFLSA